MSDFMNTIDDALRIQRERVVRRAATAGRMLQQQSGGHPQTPSLPPEQIELHAPHLVMLSRVVVETWATCGGECPQPLSFAVMDLKRALQAATASQEVAE